MGLEFYVIDTETTGLKAGFNEVTDVSIIRCSDRNQLTQKVKINFPERASDQALEITGRKFEDLLGGEAKEKVVDLCNNFFAQDGKTDEHRCIVAHNAAFDKRFCHALWGSCGKQFPAICWMDTIKFAKNWSKKIGQVPKDFKLGTVLKFAKITPLPGVHKADSDARNTYLIWKKGMNLNIDYLGTIVRYPHILSNN